MPSEIGKLIPHMPPMLFVKALAESSGKHAATEIKIDGDNIFLDRKGLLDPLAGVEFIAQTAALFSASEARGKSGKPFSGLLTGLRDFEFFHPLKSGDSVRIEVEKTEEIGRFAFFAGKLLLNGETALSGTITVWHGDNEAPLPAPSTETPVFKKGPLEEQIIENIKSTRVSGNAIEGVLSFDSGFRGFEGHFPGMPVLPAVTLVKSAMTLCLEVLDEEKFILKKINSAKFSKSVSPGDVLNVSASLENETLKARLFSGNAPAASFSLKVLREK